MRHSIRPTSGIQLGEAEQAESIPPSAQVPPTEGTETKPAESVDTTTSTQKDKWVPPEGTIFPDRGWPKYLYLFNCYVLRDPSRVPKLHPAQQLELDMEREAAERRQREAELAEQQRQREAELAEERRERRTDILTLRNEHRKPTAAVLGNQAGNGSKTTTAAYLALTWVDIIKGIPVIIVECRRDSAEGVNKHRLDTDKVQTIRKFHQLWANGGLSDENGRLDNVRVFEQLEQSAAGVFYLQADILADPDYKFEYEEAADVMRVLLSTGALVLVDTGNAPSDAITLGMVDMCHVGIYPTTTMAKSLTLRKRTFDTWRQSARSPITKDYITVLNGLKPEQNLVEFRDDRIGYVDPDRFVYTTFDSYMEDEPVDDPTTNGMKVASLLDISQHNRDAFEKLLQHVLEIRKLQLERKPSDDPQQHPHLEEGLS